MTTNLKQSTNTLMCGRAAYVLGLALLTMSGTVSVAAQVDAKPQPESTSTPKPANKRRTFDQFDVSNGIRVPSGAGMAASTPVTVETVDESKYQVISQIRDSASFCEEQLLLAIQHGTDISPDSRFERFLKHRLDGLIVLSEAERLGLLGKAAIKDAANMKLMQESEYAVKEMIAVLGAGPREYAQFGKLLNSVSERYSIPLLATTAGGIRLDRVSLMKAIMRRISANFAQLKSQVVVGK